MYDLPYHKERDAQAIEEFVRSHPFAFLAGCDSGGRPVATQVPLFMEEREGNNVLVGHLMRDTDHHKAFVENPEVLAVFTGSHAYVSGSWYSDPHIPSTWNYMSVHARGTIRFVGGRGLEDVLRKVSLHFEGDDPGSPTVYDNLPVELRRKLVKYIVAFEVTVTEVDTVFKLSQDRDRASYLNIIERLKDRDEDGRRIALEMEKRMAHLFPGD